jgi:sialidase-1
MTEIQTFVVSDDRSIYECHPDLAMGTDGNRLIAVFTERTHHYFNREFSRIVCCVSDDRGRTWSEKRPLTESSKGLGFYFDAPRISNLGDGRLCILSSRIPMDGGEEAAERYPLQYFFSTDNGESWTERADLPIYGIAPDQVLRLNNGRIIVSAHHFVEGFLDQYLIYSDDNGATWSDMIHVAGEKGYHYCEVSILPLSDGKTLTAFLRENSWTGEPCKRAVSYDNGETWSPLPDFPLPGCHRPVAQKLISGKILLLWSACLPGMGRHLTFGTLFDEDQAVAESPQGLRTFQLDCDRSPYPDTGYTGFAQYPDGEIYAVNYIADNACDCAQIRGYSFRQDAILRSFSQRVYTKEMVGE